MLRTLYVTVVEAHDLRPSEDGSRPHPFVILQVGPQTQRTTVRPSETDPRWDERFVFDVTSETLAFFEVRDDDHRSTEVLGQGALPIGEPLLKELRRGGARVTVPLQGKRTGATAGSLHLIVQGEFQPTANPRTDFPSSPTANAPHSPNYRLAPPPEFPPRTGPPAPASGRDDRDLSAHVRRLEEDVAAIRRRNEELEREQRATVGPLREELESNKKLLVQAVQCIEDLADQQRKLEAAVSTSPCYDRNPSPPPAVRRIAASSSSVTRTRSTPFRRISGDPQPGRSPYDRYSRLAYEYQPAPTTRAPYTDGEGYRSYNTRAYDPYLDAPYDDGPAAGRYPPSTSYDPPRYQPTYGTAGYTNRTYATAPAPCPPMTSSYTTTPAYIPWAPDSALPTGRGTSVYASGAHSGPRPTVPYAHPGSYYSDQRV